MVASWERSWFWARAWDRSSRVERLAATRDLAVAVCVRWYYASPRAVAG